MKDIKAIKGRYYIQRLIEEGEHECQDFKFAIGDARKIARSIAAFANHKGGRLLVGVKDNGVVAGVRSEEDIFVVEQAAEMCCVPPQCIEVTAYKTDPGQVVYKVEIAPATMRPVRVKEQGGVLRAYVRVRDENIALDPLVERAWRARSEGGNMLLQLDEGCRRLLSLIVESKTGLTPEELAVPLHLGLRATEDALLRLYAMGVTDFVFDPSRRKFLTVVAE